MRVERLVLILLISGQLNITGVHAQDAVDPDASILARLQNIEELLTNQGLLEMLQQIEALEMEISRLRGDLEVQNHVLEQIKKRQRDLYTDIDRRLQRIEIPLAGQIESPTGETGPPLQTLSPFTGPDETGGSRLAETPLTLELVDQEAAGVTIGEESVTPIVTPIVPPDQPAEAVSGPGESVAALTPGQDLSVPEETGQAAPVAPAEVVPEQVQAEYQNAFNLLKQSLYDRSVTAFREFLARYPDSEYADNAQFWLGEAYFVNSLFEQALQEYNALLENYPGSPKLAQAKLKAGFCQHELGLIEPAKQQLEELIQQYPGTTAARLAQDRLEQLATVTVPADMTPVN